MTEADVTQADLMEMFAQGYQAEDVAAKYQLSRADADLLAYNSVMHEYSWRTNHRIITLLPDFIFNERSTLREDFWDYKPVDRVSRPIETFWNANGKKQVNFK